MKYKFPEGFLWGAATSAHQIEGNNKNTQWWHYEQNKKPEQRYPLEKSEIAADSYNRFEEDFDLAQQMHNNATRLSIEWARIEPESSKFDQKEIEHYKKVLLAAKERGLKTFVTLHHFTDPIWITNLNSWENPRTPALFARYAKKCAEELGELVDCFLTINEPQVYTLQGYITGQWPPAKKKSFIKSLLVQINFIRAHNKAYKAIKKVDKNFEVGIVKNIVWYETDPFKSNVLDRVASKILNYLGRDFFLTPLIGHMDVIGLNYYFTNRVKNLKIQNPNDYLSDLHWWINPGGLENVLVSLYKRYKLPIYVTENGLADAEDKLRIHFIKDHLISCFNAIKKGVDLRGYFHWSLIDNYEWAEGFWPRFGLIEIDREDNLTRHPRPSYFFYKDVCKSNGFTHD